MDHENLRNLLEQYKSDKVSIEDILAELKSPLFEDFGLRQS